jgi:hypothetical protein
MGSKCEIVLTANVTDARRFLCQARNMRSSLIFVFLIIGTLWVFDVYSLDGRYSSAFWREAQAQSQQFTYQVQRLLNKATGSLRAVRNSKIAETCTGDPGVDRCLASRPQISAS